MNIPAESLEQFKCSKCGYHLRRAPVHLQADGLALCAACYKPPRVATRDKYYEAAARLLRFPCKYADHGCKETVPFLEEGCVLAEHEEVCRYQQSVCPLLGSSRCDWLGSRDQIAEHCRTAHSHLVLESPATLTHDIAASSQRTFLLTAFNALFLLYVKVCTSSAQIYHSIRYLGTTVDVSQFKYILQVKRENVKIEKEDRVAPQGCLAIQEPNSLALDINSLLSVLGGGTGTTFTITLQRTDTDSCEKCSKCKKKVTTLKGRCCEDCASKKIICENGCNYLDYPIKLQKHHMFFCRQSRYCLICGKGGSRRGMNLSGHYRSLHKDMTYSAGSAWQAQTGTDVSYCHLSSDFGTAFCSYKYPLNKSKFSLYVYLPLTAERLQQLCCEVKLMDSQGGNRRTYTPDLLLDSKHDWEIVTDIKSVFRREMPMIVTINFYKRSYFICI